MKCLVTALLVFGHMASESALGCTRSPVPQNLQQVEEWYGFSGYVFVAQVQTVSNVSLSEEQHSLRILEAFKGDLDPTEVAINNVGTTCSAVLKLDEQYLIFAGRNVDGRLSINGAVVRMDRATDFIPVLRDLRESDL